MKTKKVWRYYCDYCKKSGGGKWQMESHEKHCTMNPDRYCRMCKRTTPETLAQAISLLPDKKDEKYSYANDKWSDQLETDIHNAMLDIRDTVHNCPACILAILRQGNGQALDIQFCYKKEVEEMWNRKKC